MLHVTRGTHKRTSTSPAAGSGVSSSSNLVEIVPGLSYTIALYLFGISNDCSVAAAAMFAVVTQVQDVLNFNVQGTETASIILQFGKMITKL